MPLNNNLRRMRFEAGEMSQQTLAEKAGVTRMTIYSIEKGKYVPSTLLALKFAHIFNVSVEEIFSLDQSEIKEIEKNE